MKKRISLLLAVVMVLGSFASVFATDVSLTQEEAESAKFLEENGILIGNSGGLLLDKELIRQDSVILLSRLLGEEDEAKNHPITNAIKKFKDLPNDNYYKRNISWAVEGKYYEGTSNTTFSPRRALRVEEYATVLMRALGHSEENWRNNYDKAVELGILDNVNVKGPEQDILRKDVAVMTYNALGVKIKGSDVTLAQSLGIVMPEKPVEPEVKEWELRIEAPESIKSDGIATKVVKFGLYRYGKLDKTANNVVLDVNTTYGNFSQKRVTIQNGEAELILRSEFQDKPVMARIDAQIIEAEGEYKDLIGKVVAKPAFVMFTHDGKGDSEVIVVKQLVQVNSNEADRVTMIFDEDVNMTDFYKSNEKGNLIVEKGKIELRDNVTIRQENEDKKIVKAILLDPSNPKVAVAVLDKNSVLTDNKDVIVRAELNKYDTDVEKTFKLTDARKPNMTGVKEIDNRTLEVSFSEPIAETEFIIDGRFTGKQVNAKDILELSEMVEEEDEADFLYFFGDVEYDSELGINVDRRNIATIMLTGKYQEPKLKDEKVNFPNGYFRPGGHAIQASSIKDFAALTDVNNIGTTQSLEFNIKEDTTETKASVVVDSPEQLRVKFSNPIVFVGEDNKNLKATAENFDNAMTIQRKDEKGKWVEAIELKEDRNEKGKKLYKVTKIGDTFKIELTKDWTQIYGTKTTGYNHYNYKYRLVFDKESVKTISNGKVNKSEMILDLSDNEILRNPDITSPEIVDIEIYDDVFTEETGGFKVTMSEPVKLRGLEDTSESDTLNEDQKELPETKVEFIGRDKDGHIKTFYGEITEYVDRLTDTVLRVHWDDSKENPQTVVNAGGSEDWKIVIKAISDDVGNVAATVSKDFKLESTVTAGPSIGFKVSSQEDLSEKDKAIMVEKGWKAIGESNAPGFHVKGEVKDVVFVRFTDKVSVKGLGAATNVKNYTLNGTDLPAGTSIKLAKDPVTAEGEAEVSGRVIEIILPKGTLQESNVLVLAEQIESQAGAKLTKDKAFTFIVEEIKDAREAREAAETKVKALEDKVKKDEDNVLTEAEIKDAKAAVEKVEDENVKKALNTRIANAEKESKLNEAKNEKKAEIDKIELSKEEKEGKTEDSIKAAEAKLEELKDTAKKAVDEAETAEGVEAVKVDKIKEDALKELKDKEPELKEIKLGEVTKGENDVFQLTKDQEINKIELEFENLEDAEYTFEVTSDKDKVNPERLPKGKLKVKGGKVTLEELNLEAGGVGEFTYTVKIKSGEGEEAKEVLTFEVKTNVTGLKA